MLELLQKYHIEIVFIVCAMLGGIMHWLKKSMNNETDAKLLEWYGRNNIAATIYTFTVFFFAIIGSLAADIINSQTGFWAAMYTLLLVTLLPLMLVGPKILTTPRRIV